MSRARAAEASSRGSVKGRDVSWLAIFLGGLVFSVATGIAVAHNSHLVRVKHAELEALRLRQDLLLAEYNRLLLERSAFASYAAIDRIAAEELKMRFPELADGSVLAEVTP